MLVLLACAAATPTHAQSAGVATVAPLVLRGLDGHTRSLAAAELAKFTRRDTTVAAHHVVGRFGGVALTDVLGLAGAPAGDSLRGPALRTYVRVEGADGYTVILTLAEIDAGLGGRLALLADRKDGAALPPGDGPYQLVVPGDARPARWVRRVVRLSLERAP